MVLVSLQSAICQIVSHKLIIDAYLFFFGLFQRFFSLCFIGKIVLGGITKPDFGQMVIFVVIILQHAI